MLARNGVARSAAGCTRRLTTLLHVGFALACVRRDPAVSHAPDSDIPTHCPAPTPGLSSLAPDRLQDMQR
jgi:hypothetical protein